MNRTWKSVFSVLLAIALLLPVVPAARAEGSVSGKAVKVVGDYGTSSDVTAVSLKTSGANTIYYRAAGNSDEITVTATVSPANYTGKITWKPEAGAPFRIVSSQDTVSGGQATAVLAAMNPSDTRNPADLTATVGGKSASVRIKVEKDEVDTSAIVFSKTDVSVQVKKTVQLSFNKTPSYPSGKGSPNVVYKSSDEKVATVDASGKVTGESAGGATIEARIDGLPLQSKVYVTVVNRSASLTGSATLGDNFSMQDFYDDVRSEFRDTHGTYPDEIEFVSLNSANATLRTKNGAEVKADGPHSLAAFREMYLEPTGEGNFTCSAVATDGTNKLSVNITVAVSAPTVTVRVPIDGSGNYSFSKASADTSGKSGAQLIREAIGTFGSLVFEAASSDIGNAGVLYTASLVSADNRVTRGTVVAASAVDELYFTPSRAGTYTVGFTAYASTGGVGAIVCRGELVLPVDGSSLDITVNLDGIKPYTFSEKPDSSTTSLYLQLLNAINGSVGGSWGGVRFDGAKATSSTGTLHESSDHTRAISSENYIAKGALAKLYYVPERSGTYEIPYSIYGSEESTRVIASGKLIFRTSTISAGGSDITYTVSAKGSVTLRESDFVDFFQTENGSKYQLSYVVFDEYDGDGTFYHGTNSFLPYNSADFYTSTYTGSTPTNARYLKNLSFTAPSSGAGYTAVLFTCYGGTTSDGTSKATTGKLCIYYTEDDVPVVSYNAYGVASVRLKEADFVSAYNSAMGTTVSKPVFTIQLLNAPGKGTLYHYYSGNNYRTLNSNNISNYTFSINDSSGNSVDELSYAAGRNGSGTDEVTYLALSTNGTILYIGKIQFKISAEVTMNVTNDGSNFKVTDFYSASDSDPVLYVTFPQASAGKVYVYADGRYIAVSSDTKLYTISALNGQYPITSAFYAPRANETGTVSLKCVMYRQSGAKNESSITVNVLSKTSSGSFGDVGGVFSWAANSIDFASKMGLVNGTQLNPPLFSPANTMRRSDFVLMLYRLAGSPVVSGSLPYTDVPAGKYYYDSAVWAYRNNIMRNVTANGLYNPEGALTRQDFAQILFNYTVAMGESTAHSGSIASYSDASSVSANTLEGVTWAVARGYITSAVTGALYIEPTRSATRAEISTLLHRYLTY